MHLELIVLFFIIAAVYASAGFGGGSSYLAVMTLFGLGMEAVRPTSLLCNIVVVTAGAWIFWKNGFLNLRKIRSLCLASIPMAFFGGYTPLKEKTFFILLGVCLVVSAALVVFQRSGTPVEAAPADPPPTWPSWLPPALGAGIGYLSGLVGIGGGIFLAPILHLLRWDAPKNIAATASFFILVNSVFGLAGQLWKGGIHLDVSLTIPLLLSVFLGGQVGSRLNVLVFTQSQVRWITALLVLYAAVNILWKHLW